MTAVTDIFRILAACTSTMMILSPIPTLLRVWKTKQTGLASIVPLASMFANCHIYIFYGYLSEHYFPVFSTFAFGEVLCIGYLTVFYLYTHERSKANKVLVTYGVPLGVLTVYGFLGGFGVTNQTRHDVGNVFGYVNIITNLLLYSSPFEKVFLVLKHKSAVFLNIHMVCAGAFNNTIWVVYTTLTHQWIIFSVNAFCATMGWTQVVLYLVFHPSTHPYDGIIPSDDEPSVDQVDLELGDLVLSPKTRTKAAVVPESPLFVSLESPLPALAPLNVQPQREDFASR